MVPSHCVHWCCRLGACLSSRAMRTSIACTECPPSAKTRSRAVCNRGWLRLDLPPALDAEPAGAGCQAATEPAAEPAAAPAAPAAAPSAEPAVRSAPAPLPPRGRRLSLTLRHALYLRDPRRGELWDDLRGEQAWSKCPLGTAPARILRLLRAHLAALSGVGTPSERPAH
eukprot:scaffold43303_cov53-Phaeocystis_antarctica.AAC.1